MQLFCTLSDLLWLKPSLCVYWNTCSLLFICYWISEHCNVLLLYFICKCNKYECTCRHFMFTHQVAALLHEMMSWPPSWIIISETLLCQSMHIYSRNICAKFHHNLIRSDGALSFLDQVDEKLSQQAQDEWRYEISLWSNNKPVIVMINFDNNNNMEDSLLGHKLRTYLLILMLILVH